MHKCHTCGKPGELRPDCADWAYCDPCYKKMLDEISRAIDFYESKPHPAIDRLTAFAKEYKKGLAKFRTFLAESGYECTYPELQNILIDMDEAGIEKTKDSVLEYIIKMRRS